MRKYLMISHGRFALGMEDTLNLFLGDSQPFTAIGGYSEGLEDVDTQINRFMETVEEDDELVICCDIQGGSVNQKMLPYINRPKTFVLAGMNLPMLITLATLPTEEELTMETIRFIIEQSKEAVCLSNDFMTQSDDDEDFDE